MCYASPLKLPQFCADANKYPQHMFLLSKDPGLLEIQIGNSSPGISSAHVFLLIVIINLFCYYTCVLSL